MRNNVYGDTRRGTEIILSRMKINDSCQEVVFMLARLKTTFRRKRSTGDNLLIEIISNELVILKSPKAMPSIYSHPALFNK